MCVSVCLQGSFIRDVVFGCRHDVDDTFLLHSSIGRAHQSSVLLLPSDSDVTACQSSMEQHPSVTLFEVTTEMSQITAPVAEEESMSLESPSMSPLSHMEVSIADGEMQAEVANGIL